MQNYLIIWLHSNMQISILLFHEIFFQTANFDVWILNYIFQAFKPSIQDFKHCRPIISIDGTHLYEKFKDKMLITIEIDTENGIFFLAYEIVDEETIVSWSWFLFQLKTHVVKDENRVCLISDKHPDILNAIADEFIGWSPSCAYHRYSLRHIFSN